MEFSTPAAPPVADLSGSVEVAGILHVLHNATNSLASAMAHYEEETYNLKEVTRLLSRKESRDKLMSTCFESRGPLGRQLAQDPDLSKFDAHVHVERWGTVAHAVGRVLVVRDLLAWGWDLGRYAPEFRPGQHGPGDYAIKLDVVDNAIRSDRFWGTW